MGLSFHFCNLDGSCALVHQREREGVCSMMAFFLWSMNITVKLETFLGDALVFRIFYRLVNPYSIRKVGEGVEPLSISQQRNYYIFTYNFGYNQCFQTVLFIPNILNMTRWRILTPLCQGAAMSLGHLLLGFRGHGWRKSWGHVAKTLGSERTATTWNLFVLWGVEPFKRRPKLQSKQGSSKGLR